MRTPIRPLSNYVLVLPDKAPVETVSDGGIIIPPEFAPPVCDGLVCAVGPGVLRNSGVRASMGACVGDRVRFSGKAATEIDRDGKRYLLMREPEVLVVQAG